MKQTNKLLGLQNMHWKIIFTCRLYQEWSSVGTVGSSVILTDKRHFDRPGRNKSYWHTWWNSLRSFCLVMGQTSSAWILYCVTVVCVCVTVVCVCVWLCVCDCVCVHMCVCVCVLTIPLMYKMVWFAINIIIVYMCVGLLSALIHNVHDQCPLRQSRPQVGNAALRDEGETG